MRRLVLPIVLVLATVAAFVASDRLREEDAPVPSGEETIAGPITPVFSIRRAPSLLTGDQANVALTERLDRWIDEQFNGASFAPETSYCLAVRAGGETIYARNEDQAMTPASNMKLFTAGAALLALGPDFRYRTALYAAERPREEGTTEDGTRVVVDGDLYLVGGGDPLLMTDPYFANLAPDESEDRTEIRELANQMLATYGLSALNGGVLAVDSRYDDERANPQWADRFLTDGVVGVLGALVVDDGFRGWPDGYPAYDSGVAPTRSDDPAVQAAAIFDDLLEANGVVVGGAPGRAPEDLDLDTLRELAFWESAPMSVIVRQMLLGSDNTTAELVLKELGYARDEDGSTAAGVLAMSNALAEAGIDDTALFARDGSGLSGENQATCTLILDVLNHPQLRPTFRESLPVAAESGTLADDYVGTAAAGRIKAKTGFLSTVVALSGYVSTLQNTEISFSFLVNAAPGSEIDEDQAEALYATLGEALVTYPEGPSLAALGPVPVPGQAEPTEEPAEDPAVGPTPAATEEAPAEDAPAEEPTSGEG
jgi:D-alanyl-D-alanine carboxypeptidase/D-alanyl-D-alanine-endopeptidase (penicillin-binding protein 4)